MKLARLGTRIETERFETWAVGEDLVEATAWLSRVVIIARTQADDRGLTTDFDHTPP